MNPWLGAFVIILTPVAVWLSIGLAVWLWHVKHAKKGGMFREATFEYPVIQSPWSYVARWPCSREEMWLRYSKACNICMWVGAWLLFLRGCDILTKGIAFVWGRVLYVLYGRYERVEAVTHKLEGPQ